MIRLKYYEDSYVGGGIYVLLTGWKNSDFTVFCEEKDIFDPQYVKVYFRTENALDKFVEIMRDHTFKIQKVNSYRISRSGLKDYLSLEDNLEDLDELSFCVKIKVHDRALFRRIIREELPEFKKVIKIDYKTYIL